MDVKQSRRRQIAATGLLVVIAYIAGYGFFRWRTVLVHRDVYEPMPEPSLTTVIALPTLVGQPAMSRRHFISAGNDWREGSSDWREHSIGQFKNAIAQPLAVIYFPLGWCEAVFWAARDRAQ